ncbi:aldolase/citrate lyase family protein [Myxococcus sp. MxC21-1]|uniref:HpcH/HpaI aldolase/citrate lyase family protein n=1 Tax=Myxococcus sp. MxC21-1 TaxID=3041439 RepID=UPI00292D6A9E|nr:aldolase/citrate lyase family protein [Myxococcus sp. MxC21-1]WNZ58756.1 aldolase/citrate lyase family protein [Myxococcus sp. MxC21-1]
MTICFLYTSVLRFDPTRDDPGFGSDVVMIDLEDAVHAASKAKARQRLAELDLRALTQRGRRFGVRINHLASLDGIRDLDAVCRGHEEGRLPIEYLQIPKVRSHHEVVLCRSVMEKLKGVKLFPIVETPEGMDDIERIASVSDLLLFGQADITATMYRPNEAYLAQARGRFCVACARYGIPPVDTKLFEEVEDMARFEAACRESKNEGFMAKAIIHPNQVPIVKKVYSVPSAELETYQRTISSYEAAANGFAIVDGSVIAPPFVAKARLMLDYYTSQQASGSPGGTEERGRDPSARIG